MHGQLIEILLIGMHFCNSVKLSKEKKGLIASKCGDEIRCDNPDNLCYAYESMNIELPLSFILTHLMRYM